MDTPERRIWGERRPRDRVTSQIILVFPLTLACFRTFTQDRVSVFGKYLHWPCVNVSVKKKYIHCNRISVSVNFFDIKL